VRLLPIVDDVVGAAAAARDVLVAAGLRVSIDDRDETLAARVRDAQHAKVPYTAVIGRREAADDTVAVRLRDGSQLAAMPVGAFAELVGDVVRARRPSERP
jgi:threonyl-tRNA synthetase